MVPQDTLIGAFLAKRFYTPEAAAYSALYAALSPDVGVSGGNCMITNFSNFWTDSPVGDFIFRMACFVGLRSALVGIVGVPWVIATQHITYGIHFTNPSDVLRTDNGIAARLVSWSRSAVSSYLVSRK